MASTIAAIATGGGGVITTADASGSLSLLAGTTTAIACTSTGTTVAGTLNYGGVTLTSAVTGTGKMALDTNPTINNPTVTNYIESPQVVGAVGSTYQIALTLGTVLTITLTGNTPCAFAMPTPVAGKSFIVFLTQAASNMTTATFTGVKYPGGAIPTITATASAIDILSFQSNGTSWFGTFAQAFA